MRLVRFEYAEGYNNDKLTNQNRTRRENISCRVFLLPWPPSASVKRKWSSLSKSSQGDFIFGSEGLMSWIESHQDLEGHPKTLLFCQKTGLSVDAAIGRLHRLWWWALKYAEDGDLSKYDPSQFLGGLNGTLTAETVYKIMKEVKFIDESGQIHDWLDYAGRYLHSKYHTANPKRWLEIRKKNKVYLKSTFRRTLGPNNHTLPNQPNQPNHISEQNQILLESFGQNLKEKIKTYLDRVRLKNKSQVITEGRKNTLLTELFNTRERWKNDGNFGYALDQSIGKDACCIGYIDAIMKNKQTQRPA
jgi:hypothetical protein